MWANPEETAGLVTFTEEYLMKNLCKIGSFKNLPQID